MPAAHAERRNQCPRARVVGSIGRWRREMEHRAREAGEPPQRTRRVEVAEDRRHAVGTQLLGTRRACRQSDHARLGGMRKQALRAAQSDIAATDDEHARPAQDTCGFHVRAL
jgi:hypothetical protein